ncbi:guanine nucleotide exchange factor MSS4 homolog [Microplitis demolitor]|uniref:guanine nucleotide exchange factor MSS4 homolog n=1 Tax=Microplitis demolitor TaxID=69319 RepID=UPI0004CCAA10|nr:guanine nucleotide exchange factor MSS4 homolog [Microplitis demolitor]XP_053596099.1 guanine nucleotide exchange factor MSS4 homolog [Microplitis demolitor]
MSSTNEINHESKCDDKGKNKSKIYCQFCPSIILNPRVGTFVSREFSLPLIHKKKNVNDKNTDDQPENVTKSSSIEVENLNDYWQVDDMFQFENISVTQTVDQIKYLACADCELGPVGYHDIATKISYIALSRVMYKD